MLGANGVQESKPIAAAERGRQNQVEEKVDWTDHRLAKITRLRLLSNTGIPFWDVSCCRGVLKTGEAVRVFLPFHQLHKATWRESIWNFAKRDGIDTQVLGILENVPTRC